MGDSAYLYPVALRWDQGPDSLKQLKNKLLVYFMSKKSNGGDCEIRDLDCSPGYVLIHFTQEAVRDQVLLKACHELLLPGGRRMRLEVFAVDSAHVTEDPADSTTSTETPPAAAQEPHNDRDDVTLGPLSSVVLIENVQDPSPEMLPLLLENISDKTEGPDFTVEIIPEIHAAAITFTCHLDIFGFMQRFLSHHIVKQQKLTVTSLGEPSSVRAEELPPNTSADHLTLHCESPKHGGSKVQEITMFPEERAALLTFCDAASADRVLKRDHVFAKKQILLFPYYRSHQLVLYGNQRPSIQVPQPLHIPISPYILEFIFNRDPLKDNMEKQMEAQNCVMTWPKPSLPNPEITLTFPSKLSAHVRTAAKIVRTWSEEVSTKFSLIISKYQVIECKIKGSVWDTLMGQLGTPTYHGVLIKADLSTEKVFLAGMSTDVTKIEQTFRKLVEETTREVERRSQSMTMTVNVSPALYQIMCNSGSEKMILEAIPELKTEYDMEQKNVRLTGLREEVLCAKSEILNFKQSLKSKSVQINPHIVHFLMFVDTDELSLVLFVQHNINALLELEDNVVKLRGFTQKNLTEAEQQMGQELICRKVLVEDKSVLQGPEWRSLHSHLTESQNVERCTVLIEEFPDSARDEVVITGLSSAVQNSYRDIHEFLEKNTPMQKDILVHSVAVLRFLREERKALWEGLENVNVTLRSRNIHLAGAKLYVEETASSLNTVLASLHSDSLCIDKPGAKKFCTENEDMYVMMAKNKFQTVICLQRDRDEDATDNLTMVGVQCKVTLPKGVTLLVSKEDLCRLQVDVIVNAANEDLKHIGGLASAILTSAGRRLQEECDNHISRHGKLSAGESVITDAGTLPCKKVIHTVGPRWDAASPSECERLLRKSIGSSLELAAKYGHASIAIPAVSSGIFGFPIPRCAECIVRAVKEFVERRPRDSSIKSIHLVDTKDETIAALVKNVKEKFGNEKSGPSGQNHGNTPRIPERYKAHRSENQMTTKENLVIKVTEGLIQNAATDVIVNSVGKDLDVDSGGASKALSGRAGKSLQALLRDVSAGSQVEDGSVFVTAGCNLNCDIVVHVVVPKWDGGKGSSEQMLRSVISASLDVTEQKNKRSITFPAIGTGVLGFPKNEAAALMFEAILDFSSKRVRSPSEVTIMLHPSDTDTIQEFNREMNKRKRRNVPVMDESHGSRTPQEMSRKGAAFFGAVKTPTLGVHEMTVGSLTYQVKTGDITKEDTDVIVNSTDQTFHLRSGVSEAILQAAGGGVQDECATLGSSTQKPRMITTQGGNLLCKKIIHLVGTNSADGVTNFITDALHECVKLQASSVAFPAIATGLGGVASAVVADTILEAVQAFARSPQCVRTVKVVIFQQTMLQDFYASMKRKEGSDLPKQQSLLSKMVTSFWNYIKSHSDDTKETKVYELRENIEPAIFHLCAESREAVKKTSSWLQELILKEQHENVITDDWIQDFDQDDHQTLVQYQKKLQVFVSFEHPGSIVKIRGLTRDVLEMTNKIQEMTKSVRDKATRAREAELCSNLVEWRYNDGVNIVPFNQIINMEMEKAHNQKRQTFSIQIEGVKYTVFMELKSATDPAGKEITLERVSKHGLETPSHWTPMNNDNVKVVQLAHGTPEYSEVADQFTNTCRMKILKIERIQNKDLWLNYQIKKQSIDTKNGNTNNEKRLFHGTDATTIGTVNHNGFNRGYAGKNAAMYGNGTYFAVAASYSAHNQYSKPDVNGHKHMYLTSVLTGVFCQGRAGLVAPPHKNAANPTDLYDSVTDNMGNPSMFVIFHDVQAYPEYLISFT